MHLKQVSTEPHCLGSLSVLVTVRKHWDPKQLRREEFILAMVLEFIVVGEAWQLSGSGSLLITFPSMPKKKEEEERKKEEGEGEQQGLTS